MGKKTKKKIQGTYVTQLSNDFYTNARPKKSLARFVNHSCIPNAAVKKVRVAAKPPSEQLWIVATKKIESESEITINYGRGFTKFLERQVCTCNTCVRNITTLHNVLN